LLPHLDSRRDAHEAVLEKVVAGFPDDVRLIDTSTVVAELGPAALPDGMHFSAEAHERVAALIADEIRAWPRPRGRPAVQPER
jgi:lysophospholipase L1-like esterase